MKRIRNIFMRLEYYPWVGYYIATIVTIDLVLHIFGVPGFG